MLPVQVRHLLPADTTGIAELFDIDFVDMSKGRKFTIMLPLHELTDKDPLFMPGTPQGKAQSRCCFAFSITGIELHVPLCHSGPLFLFYPTPQSLYSLPPHPISSACKCNLAAQVSTEAVF